MINPIELTGDDLYFGDKKYMSVSKYKKMLHCEVEEENYTKPKSTALMVGSYVDAYISGTLDAFKENNPSIFSSRGESKGELKADYVKANEICRYIDNNELFSKFMSGEKQVVMTGEIANVPFKIKIDSYCKGIAINDLKVMATVTNKRGEFIDFITPWGYHIQMACYQEIVYQNTGERLPCYICAVTKETPINSVIVQIPQPILDSTLYDVQQKLPHLYQVFTGQVKPNPCGKCPTCIKQRITTPLISLNDLLEGGY